MDSVVGTERKISTKKGGPARQGRAEADDMRRCYLVLPWAWSIVAASSVKSPSWRRAPGLGPSASVFLLPLLSTRALYNFHGKWAPPPRSALPT